MISRNVGERPLNITSIISNFKSFIKQVYQKEWTQNINKKKYQNNISEQKIVKRSKSNLHLNRKSILTFHNRDNLLFFLKTDFLKSKFANTFMFYEKLEIIFDINTLKLF